MEGIRMRLLVAAIAATVGLSVYVTGQAAQAPQARIVFSPATDISADSIQHDKASDTTRTRGQVRILYGNSVITADEADLYHVRDTATAVDLSIELRGNVRVTLTPSAAQ